MMWTRVASYMSTVVILSFCIVSFAAALVLEQEEKNCLLSDQFRGRDRH